MASEDWRDWDCVELESLGTDATPEEMAAFNQVQRRELAARFDSYQDLTDRDSEVRAYIQARWIQWLEEATK